MDDDGNQAQWTDDPMVLEQGLLVGLFERATQCGCGEHKQNGDGACDSEVPFGQIERHVNQGRERRQPTEQGMIAHEVFVWSVLNFAFESVQTSEHHKSQCQKTSKCNQEASPLFNYLILLYHVWLLNNINDFGL